MAVADLHLGKSERLARAGAGLLPPYETRDTLDRLGAEIARLRPRCVICLGDSFDDLAAAAAIAPRIADDLAALAAGRQWIWIAGNHDPGPVDAPGSHRAEHRERGIAFRHVAAADPGDGEISGHFHPKARIMAGGRTVTRCCFLADRRRVILPAFGTYTGGLDGSAPEFDALLEPDAQAMLLGTTVRTLPRAQLARRSG